MKPNLESLVESYFLHWKTRDESLFWAWDAVTEIVLRKPEEAWPLILELVRAAPSKEALAYVGSGPIEDFLAASGEAIADDLAQHARQNARLKEALGSVWGRDRLAPRVLGVLDALAGRTHAE